VLMRLAHRYHWHHAPPLYPEGDTQLWCKWCGFRQTIKRHDERNVPLDLDRRSIRTGCETADNRAADEELRRRGYVFDGQQVRWRYLKEELLSDRVKG
jgi:hypothetical protein